MFAPLGGILFAVWFVLFARRLGERMGFRMGWIGFVVGGWMMLVLATIVFTAVYLTGWVNGIVAWTSLAAVSACAYFFPHLDQRSTNTETTAKADLSVPLLFVFAIGDLWLLTTCLLSRTDIALVSPWNVLPSTTFLIYLLTTVALWSFLRTAPKVIGLVGISLHVFAAIAVSLFVYGVGFGFDPFIHRAIVQTIVADGGLTPFSLLYSGQYAFLSFTHVLTGISIRLLDLWLIPLLVSIFLPTLFYVAMTTAWKQRPRESLVVLPLLLFVPFLPFTFTVPYHLALIAFLVTLLFLPSIGTGVGRVIVFGSAITSLFFHPLIGIPACVLAVGGWLYVRSQRRLSVGVLVAFFLACSVPIGYGVHSLLQGGDVLTIQNPWLHRDGFLALFRDPFPVEERRVHWWWNILHAVGRIGPWITMIVAVLVVRSKETRAWRLFIGMILVGFIGCLALLSTSFVFEDIISYEQLEFALRLRHALPYLGLPFLCVAVSSLLAHRKDWLSLGPIVAASVLLTVSWYVTYPTDDPKAYGFGPSVSEADVRAVHVVEELSGSEPYIALSNQMTSAAHLQEFGFAKTIDKNGKNMLYYPVPTGGDLYRFYEEIVEGSFVEDTMQRAMEFAGVSQGYFLLSGYWWGAEPLSHILKAAADQTIIVGNRELFIYRFSRKL